MKKLLLTLYLLTSLISWGQNVGINQSNPTNALHITPVTGEPIKVEGLTGLMMGDSALLIVNPSNGTVRYIEMNQLIDTMANNITSNVTFLDSIVSIIYNYGDTLLHNSNFVSSLADSIDTDIDSLVLTGTMLTAWENGNNATVDLAPLGAGGGDNWGTQVVITGTGLSGNGTSASPLVNTFTEVDGNIGNEYNTAFTLTSTALEITDAGNTFSVTIAALQAAMQDHDWYKVGTSSAPTTINDNIYTRGYVGINGTPGASIHIYNNASGDGVDDIIIQTYKGSTSNTPSLRLRSARGLNTGTSAVQNGDILGHIHFDGYDGSLNQTGASMTGFADNNYAPGNYSAGIKFSTTSASAYTEKMRIASNGNVGIGTLAPTATLSVNGAANKPGGGTWAVFSDATLKKNITNYQEGVEFILKVNTVNFEYNEKLNEIWGESNAIKDKVFQGVIAQELQLIAPDMVASVEIEVTDEDNNVTGIETVLQVDPNKFTYALINATQEQQEEIEQLSSELKATKQALEALRKQVEELSKLINK